MRQNNLSESNLGAVRPGSFAAEGRVKEKWEARIISVQ